MVLNGVIPRLKERRDVMTPDESSRGRTSPPMPTSFPAGWLKTRASRLAANGVLKFIFGLLSVRLFKIIKARWVGLAPSRGGSFLLRISRAAFLGPPGMAHLRSLNRLLQELQG